MNTTHTTRSRHLNPWGIGTDTVRNIARIALIVLPLAHLILSPVHVGALLKLENEISGFLMFLSILFGLVVLFQATRMRADDPLGEFLCILGVVAVLGFTIFLLSIYNDALRFQKPLNNPESIRKALALGTIVCIIYGFGALALILDMLASGKRKTSNGYEKVL